MPTAHVDSFRAGYYMYRVISGLYRQVRQRIVSAMAEGGPPPAKKLKEGPEGEEAATRTSGTAVGKLKKCIILLSYCGKDYMGMQKYVSELNYTGCGLGGAN